MTIFIQISYKFFFSFMYLLVFPGKSEDIHRENEMK